jgi:hypothetical protein
MKTTTFKTLLGTLTLAGVLVALPTGAFAAEASTTSALQINKNGIARVVNAEVTSVSGNLISAVTHFKDTLASWVFTTNASTTIRTGAGATSTTSGIAVGDKISVAGALTSFGSTLGVTATRILDVTKLASWKGTSGTIQSINTTNGTFVVKLENRTVSVQTNATTTWATGATSTAAFANLTVGAKVKVTGMLNADKTILTASKVVVSPAKTDSKKESGDNDKKENKSNNGKHNGLLKLNSGLHLGWGNK